MAIWRQHTAGRNPLVSQVFLQRRFSIPRTLRGPIIVDFRPYRDYSRESSGGPLATRPFLRRGRRRSFFLSAVTTAA